MDASSKTHTSHTTQHNTTQHDTRGGCCLPCLTRIFFVCVLVYRCKRACRGSFFSCIHRSTFIAGMHYIEGGWPGSNPKDVEFFERARTELPSEAWAKVVAFGRCVTRAWQRTAPSVSCVVVRMIKLTACCLNWGRFFANP